MVGEVIQITSQAAAEAAWEAYRAHAVRQLENPSLIMDREYMEEKRRLEMRWNRLFDRIDG